ncbi:MULTISPECIES: hypothetical protein [unclassified Burkholderia]|uniref:hypothetical protein n=1 Tax=unclassified Burkholderia TaxID=2613784 RepID=UPI002AB22FA5|nr:MULTISPECIES: hypothetical protein [unclassified Burkholderia]
MATTKDSAINKDFIKYIPVEAITEYLDMNPGAKRSDLAANVQELAGRDSSTLWRYLDHLKKMNIIQSEGALKGTRYYLSVPRHAQATIAKAVADIVRVGRTYALEALGAYRNYAYAAVERALGDLSHENLGKYGLRPDEFEDYLERVKAAQVMRRDPLSTEGHGEAAQETAYHALAPH